MKTNNYEIFNFMPNNRPISNGLVKRLMASILEIGYIDARPVIVNESMIIIDGQHRFEACKRLGLPIVYSISNVDMNKAMLALNKNQISWHLHDFIVSHAHNGIQCYIDLLDFYDKYKFNMTATIAICFGAGGNSSKIRAGFEFKINKKRYEMAKFILDCSKHFDFSFTKSFVYAVESLFRKSNESQRAKLLYKIQSLQQQATSRGYLIAFENIINKSVRIESQKISLSIN